jgi:hypothetical protein
MTSAASVLVCALSLLGRSPESLPDIELLDVPPPDVSANAEAFVDQKTRTIYILTTSAAFRAVRESPYVCGSTQGLRKLASIIVHEEWHIRNGRDEEGAYSAQLIALLLLGEQAGSPMYMSVQRSMWHVLDNQRRARAAMMARR